MTDKESRRPAEFPLQVLREYALLADGERGILVGPRGDFAWMCAPRWDSGAVFSSLIGGGGMYAVTPADHPFVWGGYYEQNTLIWHSRWVTSSQMLECREALAFPGDPHTAVVLRRILAVDGQTQVRVVLDPRAGFGRHRMSPAVPRGAGMDGALRAAVPALVRRGRGREPAGRHAAGGYHRAGRRLPRSRAGDLRPAHRRGAGGPRPGMGGY